MENTPRKYIPQTEAELLASMPEVPPSKKIIIDISGPCRQVTSQEFEINIIELYPLKKNKKDKPRGYSLHVYLEIFNQQETTPKEGSWQEHRIDKFETVTFALRGNIIKYIASRPDLFVRLTSISNFDKQLNKEVYFPVVEILTPLLKARIIASIKRLVFPLVELRWPELIAATRKRFGKARQQGRDFYKASGMIKIDTTERISIKK